MNDKRKKTLEIYLNELGKNRVQTKELRDANSKLKDSLPMKSLRWITEDYGDGHGWVSLPTLETLDEAPTVSAVKVKGEVPESVKKETESLIDDVISFIPEVDQHFVRWGNCKDVESIVKSCTAPKQYITN